MEMNGPPRPLRDLPLVPFLERVRALPTLGLGVSTEYGARSAGGLDPLRLAREHPPFARFLEVGVERGLDAEARIAAQPAREGWSARRGGAPHRLAWR